jgi:hypothetical protein
MGQSNKRPEAVANSMAPEHEGLSLHLQKPTTGPYAYIHIYYILEPIESTPHPHPISQRSILIPPSRLRLRHQSGVP